MRKMNPLNQEICRQAAEWASKRTSGTLSPEDMVRFEAWVAADTKHLGAYGRAIAVLARLDRLSAVGASALRPTSGGGPVWSRRHIMLAGGAASGLAAAGFAGVALWDGLTQQDFSTAVGETRVVVLADRSIATLNTNSKMVVQYSAQVRKIRLLQGEVFFKVTKNNRRPFIVFAGDSEVRAVGTSFMVRFLQQRPVQILVQEGVVEVTRKDAPNARPVRSVAETQTIVPRGKPIVTRPVSNSQITRGLAWQYGQIAFDNVTLQVAAIEFARYSNTRIIIDPAVSDRTITGMFPSNDPIGFAKAAAAVLNLRLDVGPDEVRIIR